MIAYHTEDVKTKIVIPTTNYNIPFFPWQKSLLETVLCFPCAGSGNTLTTNEEKEIYDKVSAELENYWTIEEEAMTKGAKSEEAEYLAAQKIAAEELEPIYNEVYQS